MGGCESCFGISDTDQIKHSVRRQAGNGVRQTMSALKTNLPEMGKEVDAINEEIRAIMTKCHESKRPPSVSDKMQLKGLLVQRKLIERDMQAIVDEVHAAADLDAAASSVISKAQRTETKLRLTKELRRLANTSEDRESDAEDADLDIAEYAADNGTGGSAVVDVEEDFEELMEQLKPVRHPGNSHTAAVELLSFGKHSDEMRVDDDAVSSNSYQFEADPDSPTLGPEKPRMSADDILSTLV